MRLLALALMASGPTASWAEPPPRSVAVTIVRPSGSPFDQPLVERLQEKLVEQNVHVVRIEALRQRIGRLTERRDSRAPLELTAARALELEARFLEAAQRYAAAVRALVRDPRTLPEPRRIADAELFRGASAILDGDEQQATRAMRSALGWVEDLEADPTFTPEARQVLRRARELGSVAAEVPAPETLGVAMSAARARFLAYVTVGGPRGGRTIRTVVIERGRGVLKDEVRAVGADEGLTARRAAERIAAAIAAEIPLPPPPPPLWRNPFFLGAVGAVLIGGVAVTLYATAERQVDVTVDF